MLFSHCGFALGDPKPLFPAKFPLPPIMNSPNFYRDFSCVPPLFLPSTFLHRQNEHLATRASYFETLCFSQGYIQSSSTHSHLGVTIYDTFFVPFGVCCFLELKVRSRHQCRHLESVLCPLPGRFSLWYILALGNIDLNALCFDLNQFLPVYLYR